MTKTAQRLLLIWAAALILVAALITPSLAWANEAPVNDDQNADPAISQVDEGVVGDDSESADALDTDGDLEAVADEEETGTADETGDNTGADESADLDEGSDAEATEEDTDEAVTGDGESDDAAIDEEASEPDVEDPAPAEIVVDAAAVTSSTSGAAATNTTATSSATTQTASTTTTAKPVKVAAQSTTSTKSTTTKTTTTTKKTTSAKTNAKSVPARTLADGIYYIESRLNVANVLGIAGGSTSNGGNAFSVVYDGTAAQQWKITYNAKTGMYTIINEKSGLALDVDAGKAANGRNIQQYKSNNTKAQQWQFVKKGSGYIIKSALGNYVLDIAGANQNSGTNVQLYTKNDTKAQWWQMISTKPLAAEKTVLDDGAYTISVKAKTSKKFDVAGGSADNGANVQIYAGNGTLAQRWYITHDKSNYYTITCIGTGKVLDITAAKRVAGTNVQQYTSNGTSAQKWVLHKNSDGSYTFLSKLNGMALDLAAGKVDDGTNVQTYFSNGTDAQKFKLTKQKQIIPDGVYSIAPSYATGKALDVPSASTKSGAQLQIWDYDEVIQQKYQVTNIGDDIYTMTAGISGMNVAFDSTGKKVIQKKASKTDKAQQWSLIWTGSGVTFKNVKTGKVIDIAGAGESNGTKAQAYKSNGTKAQKFILKSRPVIEDGVYIINSAVGPRVLEIAASSTANGGNVRIMEKTEKFNQRFYITAVGNDGYYKIVNVYSNKAVDVAGASKANAANVQQYDYNGSGAQLWKAEFNPNGGITFVNKNSGKALDVKSGADYNGANVDIYKKNNTKAQRWTLTRSNTYTDLQMVAYRKAVEKGSKTNWFVATDLTHHRVYVFHRTSTSAMWELQKDWICTSGQAAFPTPTGDYTVKRKRYSYEGYYGEEPYIAYYYTSIGNTGKYFHSPLYAMGAAPGSKSYGGWGKNLSLGCVRLYLDNAIFMYNNVDVGTKVTIYH